MYTGAVSTHLTQETKEEPMSPLSTALRLLERVSPAKAAYAHCDIPCGIYDPYYAQIAALSVVRMDQLIKELGNPSAPDAQAKLARYVKVKEDHAEIYKHELRVIWGDYFRPEHVQQYPNLHDLFFRAMKAGSQGRQTINLEAGETMLKTVHEIAEIFWKTKNVETKKISSHQTVGGELVVPAN
jgi:nickel superoxide dismutase